MSGYQSLTVQDLHSGLLHVVLGVGEKVPPPEQQYPAALRAGSIDRPHSSVCSHHHFKKAEATTTALTLPERVTGTGGLGQLVPRKTDDSPEPDPALRKSVEHLKTQLLDGPPLAERAPNVTTPTSLEQDPPLLLNTTAKKPTHVDHSGP